MRWAVPVFLACLACLPGAADAGGQAERRPAASTLLLVLDFAPSWSADGTRIAFTRYRHGFGTISADGSGERWIEADVIRPAALSPDGEWFAFASDGGDPVGLSTIRADGSEPRLLRAGYGHGAPVWSPDSRRIAFQAPDGALWVVDRDGGVDERLASLGADPTWSPDGRWIAFSARGTGDPASADLMVVSSWGGAARALVESRGTQVSPR